MPEEGLRRSSRSTKGINARYGTGGEGSPPQALKVERDGNDAKEDSDPEAPETGDDDEYTEDAATTPPVMRCVCEEPGDTEGALLCCTRCRAWQHGDCLGVERPYQYPLQSEAYACPACSESVAADTTPAAAQQRKHTARARRAAAGSLTEDPHSGHDAEQAERAENCLRARERFDHASKYGEDATGAKRHKPRPASRGSKRQRATKTEAEEQQPPLDAVADSVEDVRDSARQGTLNALIKTIIPPLIREQEQSGATEASAVPKDVTKFALALEHAIFAETCLKEGISKVNEAYRAKLRTIAFNLKKNPELRAQVLSGELTCPRLVTLTSEEMASQEIRMLAKTVREASTHNSVLVNEQGPRIRRTHKGEEIVYMDNEQKEDTVPQQQLPLPAVGSSSAADKQSDSRAGPESERSSEGVAAAEGDGHQGSTPVFGQYEAPIGDIDDPELHKGWKDYTLDDYYVENSEPVVWSGRVEMAQVAACEVDAVQVGGIRIAESAWRSELIGSKLEVLGRSAIADTTQFLAQSAGSASRKVLVLALRPAAEHDKPGLDALYSHFTERKRYGPFKGTGPLIRDSYLIPLEPEAYLGSVLDAVPDVALARERSNRLLLAIVLATPRIADFGVPASTEDASYLHEYENADFADTGVDPIADADTQAAAADGEDEDDDYDPEIGPAGL